MFLHSHSLTCRYSTECVCQHSSTQCLCLQRILNNNILRHVQLYLSVCPASNLAVSVVSYTVSVGGADSSLTIADSPSTLSLLNGFQGSPYTLCACVALKTRQLRVTGSVDPANMTQIEHAIATAWRKENSSESNLCLYQSVFPTVFLRMSDLLNLNRSVGPHQLPVRSCSTSSH